MERLDTGREPTFEAAAALQSSLGRAAAGAYLVEGEKLVRQALAAGRLRQVLVSTVREELAAELERAGQAVHLLAPRLFPKLVGTGYETRLDCVGLAARVIVPALPGDGLLLAAERIQDPRNVGVLVRTAEAAGVAALALTDDSADPFARAAVRSSTGSILRQPVYLAANLPADLARWRAAGGRVVAASARATRSFWDCDFGGRVCLLVGNESDGLSDGARELADETVALPQLGEVSSLNVTVAAGILLYEALRQRRVSHK